jgi:KipI family sensor histidine kinase inhibitor
VTRRVLPYGPGGWLVEVDPDDVVDFAATVRAARHAGVAEVVPAARTVLVGVRPDDAASEVGEWLATLAPVARVASRGDVDFVEVPVVYDGDDLAAVAAACGMATTEVIARHSAITYQCTFCGFAPGFGYLAGLDPALHLARRATPRTRVPAGSVAIAAEYAAVYPSPSPGGWHLVGHTTAVMWDPSRESPALVAPGTAVRFVATGR